MNNEQKKRLIELIIQSVDGCARNWAETIADYLLEHNVVVLCGGIGMTNYEKIKNMSVEEMAQLLCNAKNGICPKICNNESCGYIIDSHCRQGIKQWLNSEVKNEKKDI